MPIANPINTIEAFFSDSIDAVSRNLISECQKSGADAPGRLGWADFLLWHNMNTMCKKIATQLNHLDPVAHGEVRPLLHMRPHDPAVDNQHSAPADLKACLLYSPSAVVIDPFEDIWEFFPPGIHKEPHRAEPIAYDFRQRIRLRGHPPHIWLTNIVAQLAALKPAASSGLVDFMNVPFNLNRNVPYVLNPEEAQIAWSDHCDLSPIDAQAVVAREVSMQVAAVTAAPGYVNSFVQMGAQEVALRRLLKKEIEAKRRARKKMPKQTLPSDLDTVRRLLNLKLPGVGGVRIKDLVLIRDDRVFADVRQDVRLALSAAGDLNDFKQAQLLAAEVFASRATSLERPKLGKSLSEKLIGNVVQYGVSSALAWKLAGEQLILPMVIASGATAAFNARTKRERQAQRRIYVSLGETVDTN